MGGNIDAKSARASIRNKSEGRKKENKKKNPKSVKSF